MKMIWIVLLTAISIIPLRGEPVKGVDEHGYIMPKTDFRELLEIAAKIANKQVIVTSEDDLKIQTSLVLLGPISYEKARKVIGSLLILEGYELVESGEELQLKRILTKEQCDAFNKALGRVRIVDDRPLPRKRVIGRAEEAPKPWVVVRPVGE